MRKTLKQITSCFLVAALALSPMLGQMTPAADAATATLTSNPQRVSVHDPSIAVSKEGVYYAFGTHIDAAKSTDMVNWTKFTNGYASTNNQIFGDIEKNLAEPFKWAGCRDKDARLYGVWAPDVFWNDAYVNTDGTTGAYMMYFCTTSTWKRSVIAYAVSQNIEGPYNYVDSIIYSDIAKTSRKDNGSNIDKSYENTNIPKLISDGILKDGTNGISSNWFDDVGDYNFRDCPNAIDPTVFEDKDGKLWMTYGSWSGGIFILPIDAKTGAAIYPGKSQKKNENGLFVDEYYGTRLAGGNHASGEGPYILYDKASDYYYMYLSYDTLTSDGGYHMRLFRSKNPDGPYEDAAGNNATASNNNNQYKVGVKVMGAYTLSCLNWQEESDQNIYKAQGHNSALVDSDGQRYLIYHTRFDDGSETHELRVHQQFINEQGWPVTSVFENKGDTISETGYSSEDVIGTYEYLDHGITSDLTTHHSPQTITLKKDGTVTGAIQGTWTAKEGTYYMSVKVGNVTYSGVFFRQHDEAENSKPVMTFTAIGTDNHTIWGAKKAPALKVSASTLYVGGDTGNTTTVSIANCSETEYSVTYTSSNAAVATVASNGKITAKKAGTTTIKAAVTIGSETKNLSKTITVKKASLKFSSKKASLKAGKSFKFKAKGSGIKASSITYSSSKPSVLKIDKKTGKATAKKKGKAIITAKFKNIKVKYKVTVTAKK